MKPRNELTLILLITSLFSFGLSVLRYKVTGSGVFLFLNWNLFLAFVPWVFSSVAVGRAGRIHILCLLGLLSLWLLFFPNCPYILTDLFHLKHRAEAPIWYDLVVILSFAWAGLMFGFLSLMDIEKLIAQRLGSFNARLLAVFFIFLGSFGVYLGRFLRWNSWDIVSNPFGLFNDIYMRLANPLDHSRTWGLTIFMGILLNLMYFTLKSLRKQA